MKYALIGCGRISPNHIVAAKNNGLEIVAICDVEPKCMEDKVKKFSLPNTVKKYTDYHELLNNEKPDLVAICTESGIHAEIAIDCINAGCNVIIEKPIALSIADANAIIEAAKKNNVKVCVSHQNRFNKSIAKIKDALDKERFGRLFHGTAHIRWARDWEYYSRAKWRGTWAQDGGCLMNQCIHNIDLLIWLMGGKPTEVMAYTDRMKHDYIEAEDLGVAVVKFANGTYGIIEGTTNVYPKNLEETLYIFGEKGTVKAGGASVNKIEEWNFSDELDVAADVKSQFSENPPSVYGFGHTPLYADAIEAIESDRAPMVTAEDGKKALEMVLAIYKSAAEGRPIQFPLVECSTLDFSGRFDHE